MAIETVAAGMAAAIVTAAVKRVVGTDDLDQAIAEAIGSGAENSVRKRLEKWFKQDDRTKALEEVTLATLTAVKAAHPDFVRDGGGFDATFVEVEAADELAKVFGRDTTPDPGVVAGAWSKHLLSALSLQTAGRLVAASFPASETLVDEWTRRVRDLPMFSAKFDSVDTARTADNTGRLVEVFGKTPADTGHELAYLERVEEDHTYVDTAGTGMGLNIPLTDVYLNLTAVEDRQLDERDRLELDRHRQELEQRFGTGEFDHLKFEVEVDDLYARFRGTAPSRTRHPVLDIVAGSPIVAILGDPGSGKTTLLRWLALRHAHSTRVGLADVGSDDTPTTMPARFPIYVRAGMLVSLPDWKKLSLTEFLAEVHRIGGFPNPASLSDLFDRHLRSGDCLVLFDGIDEIPDASDRRVVVERFEGFVKQWAASGNRFVATSRIAGYRSAPLSAFEHHQVADLDLEDDVPRFVLGYCQAMERLERPGAGPESIATAAGARTSVIASAFGGSSGLARLAVNPLLLSILIFVQRNDTQIPKQRALAYHKATEALERGWRVAQHVPEDEVPTEDARRYLPLLASWIHRHRPAGIVTFDDIVEAIGTIWADRHGHSYVGEGGLPDGCLDELRTFVDDVTEQCGLLVERAPERWAFLHQTFQEFYVAHNYRNQRDEPRALRTDLHDPRYEEPIRLALGIRSHVNASGYPSAEDLFDAAILAKGELAQADPDFFRPAEFEDLLHRDRNFAWRASNDDLRMHSTTAKELAKPWVAQIEMAPAVSAGQTFGEVGSALRPHIVPTLRDLAADTNTNDSVRRYAARALGQLGDTTTAAELLRDLAADTNTNDSIRSDAAQALGQLGALVPPHR